MKPLLIGMVLALFAGVFGRADRGQPIDLSRAKLVDLTHA